jgi:sulfite reductase beta subunit-like hemoprotein
MIRMRAVGGDLDARQVATVVDVARQFSDGHVHVTTRQNLELHSVRLEDVPMIYAALEDAGLAGRSSCGHTIRNVMACSESATSIEEPFDVLPDARRLSSLLISRSSELNIALPSRMNIVLGGCTRCGVDALINDIGLVAITENGECGYQLWVGGSLGTAPRLSFLLRPFLRREEVWPAVWTVVEWFCTEGDIEHVARGRLKFLVEARGEGALRQHFAKSFPRHVAEDQPPLEPVEPVEAGLVQQSIAWAPPNGWSGGVRPERRPGFATVTVRVPRGDLLADHLEAIAELVPATSTLRCSRDQNLVIGSVPTEAVSDLVTKLATLGFGPDGVRSALDIAACPGLTFCSLALTGSQELATTIERMLESRIDLPRDPSIAISGCPNSCAKQQIADIGLAGTKLRLGGETTLGYHLVLGADIAQGLVGEPVLKLAEREVPTAVVAVLESWVALRRPSETMATTFRRIGLETIGGAIALRLRPADDRFVTLEEATA